MLSTGYDSAYPFHSDKQQLENYIFTKERIANLEKAELKLKDYCQRLHGDLDNATHQYKRKILEMLAIKVTATPERIDVHGIIPIEATPTQTSSDSLSLLTTERTWGYQLLWTKNYSAEEDHPVKVLV